MAESRNRTESEGVHQVWLGHTLFVELSELQLGYGGLSKPATLRRVFEDLYRLRKENEKLIEMLAKKKVKK